MNIYQKLLSIQTQLKAPKSQFNAFGKYNYRNCEDILEALKPYLNENKAIVLISDKPLLVGNRIYIEATVKFVDIETGEMIETTSIAREEETKKGMDSSQITGSASSYARKYALNGMFAIDDTKDSDTTNKGNDDTKKESKEKIDTKNTDKCTREEYIKKIKLILWEVSGENELEARKLLEEYTSFVTKEGKQITGVTDTNKLSLQRLQATYGNIKRFYPEVAEKVKIKIKERKKEAV